MKQTLSLLCPESMMVAGNHLAAAKGQHIDDLLTFRRVTHTRDGQSFCVASVQVSAEWLQSLMEPLKRPDYDTDGIIDLTAATEALQAVQLVTDSTTPEELPALPSGIVMGLGIDLVGYYGLTKIVED